MVSNSQQDPVQNDVHVTNTNTQQLKVINNLLRVIWANVELRQKMAKIAELQNSVCVPSKQILLACSTTTCFWCFFLFCFVDFGQANRQKQNERFTSWPFDLKRMQKHQSIHGRFR